MQVEFAYQGLEKLMSRQRSLVRKYGPDGAKKVSHRMSLLQSADTLADMRHLPGRCHELTGDRSGQLALDLHGGYRLVFRPAGNWSRKNDGGLDWSSVSAVEVIEISDHYNN